MGFITRTGTWYQAPPFVALTRNMSTDNGGRNITTVSVDGTPRVKLTEGCKTVVVQGPARVLQEMKSPFTDNFARTFTGGWGSSGGGGNYSVTGTASNYSVSGGYGRILSPGTVATNRFATVLDTVQNPDVRVKVTCDKQPAGGVVSAGIAFDYKTDGTGSDNHYRAGITFGTTGAISVNLTKVVATVTTTLATSVQIASGFIAGQWVNLRIKKTGSSISVWGWQEGSAEPTVPTLTATDTSFTSGRVGVRAITNTGGVADTTCMFDDFIVSAYNPTSPTINSTSYVYVLKDPYEEWNILVERQVRAWLTDLPQDVLATALEYAPNAPDASVAATGIRVKGRAFYGAKNATGGVDEGSDFNDYLGIPWTYDSGTVDQPEPAELGCLDCSGHHRMVWGYRFGIPLALTNPDFFNGIRLPRRSKDQGPLGPGVLIASAVGAAPSYADLTPGDNIFFDATNGGDEESNELDHVGIYLGVDTNGNKRFISSRKTPNGPTMGDLAGASTVDAGTNLYSQRARLIRRY
jgi:cell wall-associated NlpC family hydrolase